MTFCTIVTPGYIHYAIALRQSLIQFDPNVSLYILITENNADLKYNIEAKYQNVHILFPGDLCGNGIGKAIYDKYYINHLNGFRWSMKPVLLNYLLQKQPKVVYVDSDIHFYANYSFIFSELDTYNILLTPHWRSSDPVNDEFNFLQLYVYGLYNGGFIAANSKGVEALEWWAKVNLFICEVNAAKGQHDDQAHLNLLPIYFEAVKPLKHRGCNVAGWNLLECKRSVSNDGTVLINEKWPIIFIHYSESTIWHIEHGADNLLKPYMEVYIKRVIHFGEILGTVNSKSSIKSPNKYKGLRIFAKLNNKLKLLLNGS